MHDTESGRSRTMKEEDEEVHRLVKSFSPTDDRELLPALLDSLAEAFLTDPTTLFFCRSPNDPRAKRAAALYQFRVLLRCLRRGRWLLCLADSLKGAIIALDYPHEQANLGAQILRGAAWMIVRHVPPSKWATAIKMGHELELMVRQYMKEHGLRELLYLYSMGVHPDLQGQGLGSRMMARFNGMDDRAGRHIYLEATTLRSRALYERHGFVLISEYRMRPDAPPMYAMARTPQPVTTTTDDRLMSQRPT